MNLIVTSQLAALLHFIAQPPPLGRVILDASLCAASALAQKDGGTLDFRFNPGAADCHAAAPPPLEVHPFNESTYIIRESLCATFEAPIMYLLIGSQKALLIDSGDVADPHAMPLADTVLKLLPTNDHGRLPLLVAHTHRHQDHRAGDGQFAGQSLVQVIGFDLDSVKRDLGFLDWPNRTATIDLGDRTVDVIPTPGHNATHIAFYDRNTALFFSGDFFMPGRLLIEDKAADLASAKRVVEFLADRPVRAVLGAHIELGSDGRLFDWGSTYHPNEHALAMSKEDLMALPGLIEQFNGWYSRRGPFVMVNQNHMLLLWAALFVVLIGLLGYGAYRLIRRRSRRRAATVVSPAPP
ncbi:MAG TPA: MBL fold metallo-hydrolase [Steroidobacteraceae bacterium]